ncbi:MAG: fibronectin type III domain-containing protein [Candidatus Blackburnbacteria bacterium]|nr:fibronectin type III domain-containing protein [Candidatus Blackburnbacteria bacterium]
MQPDSLWKRVRLPLLGLLVSSILIFVLLPFLVVAFEPTSTPVNVLTSNVTDHQATVSWTTQKATKGTVTIGKVVYKDDGDKTLKRQGFYSTHHVTLSGLQPNKTYRYEIRQGRHKLKGGVVRTAKTSETLPSPNPVYGKVLTKDKKPIVGAIIYFRVANGDTKSSLLTTLTNSEGRWSLDLANLRNSDVSKNLSLSSSSIEEIVVEAGSNGSGKATSTIDKDTPWPDIIVKGDK